MIGFFTQQELIKLILLIVLCTALAFISMCIGNDETTYAPMRRIVRPAVYKATLITMRVFCGALIAAIIYVAFWQA